MNYKDADIVFDNITCECGTEIDEAVKQGGSIQCPKCKRKYKR
jgi:hypothetical protein